jgi:type II secretory pathway pseudopilin PulG
MASAGVSGGEIAIRVGLALVIVGLVVVLYFVTVVPAREAAAAERETALARQRLSDVRTALIAYRDSLDGYPSTLDSLVLFARTDSTFQARIATEENRAAPLSLDSLLISPRSGEPFRYELIRDTSGVEIYWLADVVGGVPGDSIGARYVDPALRNAASWE